MTNTILSIDTIRVFENNNNKKLYMGVVRELAREHPQDEYYQIFKINTGIYRLTKKDALNDARLLRSQYQV